MTSETSKESLLMSYEQNTAGSFQAYRYAASYDLTKIVSRASSRGWQQRIAAKQDATHPYSILVTNVDLFYGYDVSIDMLFLGAIPQTPHVKSTYMSQGFVPINTSEVCDPKAISIALGHVLGQVSEKNHAWKALPFLGELRETIRTIKRPMIGVFRGLRDYKKTADKIRRQYNWFRRYKRRISKQRIAGWNRSLANAWLEAAFVIQPLVGDTLNALQAYEEYFNQPVQSVVPLWGNGYYDGPVTSSSSIRTELYMRISNHFTRTTRHSCRYTGEYGYKVSPLEGDVGRAMRVCGFSLAEFVPTLWELMPYSWLVDYFSNVGQIVSSAFVSKQNVIWMSRSTKVVTSQSAVARLDVAGTQAALGDWFQRVRSNRPGFLKLTTTSFNRGSGMDDRFPGLVLDIPGLPVQWANMIALLVAKA